MSEKNYEEDKAYLKELKRLRDNETKNVKVKKFLDTEILACDKKLKYHKLLNDRKKVFEELESLEEILGVTSQAALRKDLVDMMLPLQNDIKQLSEKITRQEMNKSKFRKQLIECEEKLALLLFSLQEGSEFDKAPTKPDNASKESPWLKLCQAETGLDAHQSGLPTTTITSYAFDESEEYAKVYIDVPGLDECDNDKLKLTFSERHFSLLVADVDGCNYKFHITNLTELIDVDKSKIRPKKGRVIVFLKKKHPTTWTSLTPSNARDQKDVDEEMKQNTLAKCAELAAISQLLKSWSSEEEKELFLMEKGFYSVRDMASARKALALMDVYPVKICNFQWYDKSPGAEEILRKVIEALDRFDCCVAWINVSPWADRRRAVDDRYLELITERKRCRLVHFVGRLGAVGWSTLPRTALSVSSICTCTADFDALSASSGVFDAVFVEIYKGISLSELKPLRTSVSKEPISLAFSDLVDSDVEWVVDAIKILLPFRTFPNHQHIRLAFKVVLPSCQMTNNGLVNLGRSLPPDLVRLEVHDASGSLNAEFLARLYAVRNCKFAYLDEATSNFYRGRI